MTRIQKLKRKWVYYFKPTFLYMKGQFVVVRPMCAPLRHRKKVNKWFMINGISVFEMDFPKVVYLLYTENQIREFKEKFSHYFVK